MDDNNPIFENFLSSTENSGIFQFIFIFYTNLGIFLFTENLCNSFLLMKNMTQQITMKIMT